MKRKATFVGLVFFCVFACGPQQSNNKKEVVELDPAYSGRLYTSGLSPEEVERLEISEDEQAGAGDLSVYRSKLRWMVRPAPDIASDYALQLQEPYRDENQPEEPTKLISELPRIVLRPDKLNKPEDALADVKTVVIEADPVTGYAEATALRVAKILRSEVEKEEVETPEA